MRIRFILPLVFTLLITQSDLWLPILYKKFLPQEFSVIGTLEKFKTPCGTNSCKPSYKIPMRIIESSFSSDSGLTTIGVGRFFGTMNWYCSQSAKRKKIFETGAHGKTSRAMDLFQYQIITIPASSCSDDLEIEYDIAQGPVFGKAGWKSGATVVGSLGVVTAFKNISDFFSTYTRALLGILVLIFVCFEGRTGSYALGSYWSKMGAVGFAILAIASCSMLDFLMPGLGILGLPLLKAGGTFGVISLCLSHAEVIAERKIRVSKYPISLQIGSALMLLVIVYWKLPGILYTVVQSIFAISLLFISLRARAPTGMIIGILLCSDLLAVTGVFAGFPTTMGVHIFLISYCFDTFEWMIRNNNAIEILANPISINDCCSYLKSIAERFNISRISYSVFSDDGRFNTYQITDSSNVDLKFSSKEIPRLSANVMTARAPLLRVNIFSKKAELIRGHAAVPDSRKGIEYSVFPLIHDQKVVGTINITGYSPFVIGDSSQLSLFLSNIEKFLPRFSEALYKAGLSPNQKEERRLLEIESTFLINPEKSFDTLRSSIDAVCSFLDLKIIISQKIPGESRFKTFSNHNYPTEVASFLDTHKATISETIVANPANVAFSRREPVFVNDVVRLFPVYPEFLVNMFQKNETRGLWVTPVFFGSIEPWGVIWIEFKNRLQRPDADLRELALAISSSIENQMNSLFEYQAQQRMKNELGTFIPVRVLSKIEAGISPREEEAGFLLNIDLTGSTAFAKSAGDVAFSMMIAEASLALTNELQKFGLKQQMIIWDAFIFTCSVEAFDVSRFSSDEIKESIANVISKLSCNRSVMKLGYRAILHFGDITRDLSQTDVKKWSITGAALAESCKLEQSLKNLKNEIFISEDAYARLNCIRVA